MFFDFDQHTRDVARFIELTGITDWDLKIPKSLFISHMCQDLSYAVKDFEFNNTPHELLDPFTIENF